jgi:hypothetical protein
MDNGITNYPRVSVNKNLIAQDKLIFRYGAHGNVGIILAVNIANRTSLGGQELSNVQFALPDGVRLSQVEVLTEARTLPVTNGVFTDNFNRFEVHAYRFVIESRPNLGTGLRIIDNNLISRIRKR